MKLLFISTTTLFLISCNRESTKEAEKPKQTNLTPKKEILEISSDSIKPRGRKITIGYSDNYEKLPKLVFDSISEATFNKLKEKEFLRQVKPEQKETYFSIETAFRKHTFKKYMDYGEPKNWNGYELLGYYPNLKSYVLTKNATSEHLGFGELFLLDSVTDYHYSIISPGDGSVETPIPSPNNKYLVYYYNAIYAHPNSDICILKINDKSNPQNYLSEYAHFNSTEFAVEQIIWKADHCFYVKGYKEIYDEPTGECIKKYTYYRTIFK